MLFLLSYAPCNKKRVMVWTQILLLFSSFLVLYICHAWQNNGIVFVVILPLILPLLLVQKDGTGKRVPLSLGISGGYECYFIWKILIQYGIRCFYREHVR